KLAKAYAERGDRANARRHLEDGRKAAPDAPELLSLEGALLCDEGDLASGSALFKQALEADPDDLTTRVRLGQAYFELGRREDAIRELRAILTLAPGSDQA